MKASIMNSNFQMENFENAPIKKSNMFESKIFTNDNNAIQTSLGNNASISPFNNLKDSGMAMGLNGIPEANEEYASNSNSIKVSINNNNPQGDEEFGMNYMDNENEESKDENEKSIEKITLKEDRKKNLKNSSKLKQSYNFNMFEFGNPNKDNELQK